MGPQSDLLDTRGLLYLLSVILLVPRLIIWTQFLVPSGTKFYRLAYCSFRLNKEDAAERIIARPSTLALITANWFHKNKLCSKSSVPSSILAMSLASKLRDAV